LSKETASFTVIVWTPSETLRRVAWNVHTVGRLPTQFAATCGSTAEHTTEFGSITADVPSSVADFIEIDVETLVQFIAVEK
jgi:hypothetical protein